MNISTLAKILGVSVNELRTTGKKNSIPGFNGRNTRINYQSAQEITKLLKPEKLLNLKDDDKIYTPATIAVVDLAEAIGKPPGILVKSLLLNGIMATLNEKIDFDTAALISEELGVKIHLQEADQFQNPDKESDLALVKSVEYDIPDDKVKTVIRPPVVTIMGHVDHGKTTLLDTIRKSNIVATEAGSITQHISSYQIQHQNKTITFIDTPGHAAFTAMRARGSQLADFVILVVSATEGPKPQTVEVIERLKLTKTPVIVAINKIDLPEADPEKVKADVASFGLVPEEWGGQVPYLQISALKREGITELLDTILLHTEVANLEGQVDCPGQAVVLESNLDTKLGVVSTVLVTKDSLQVGDYVQAGSVVGKIRKLEDSTGKDLTKAGLSRPVLLVGLPQIVDIGEALVVYKSKKEAVLAADEYKAKNQKLKVKQKSASSSTSDDNSINLVLKADVNGSLEALKESILKIPQEKVKIQIKSEGVGEVTENDVEFARTSEATILAFNAGLHSKAARLLETEPIPIIQSDIIYVILEWVEEQILKNTKHEIRTEVVGEAEVLATFKSDRPTIQVFGGEVKMGKILDNKEIRLVRDNESLGIFEIADLQKNKQTVKEVNISQQFGISIKSRVKVKKGDIIQSVDQVVVK